MLTTFNWWTVIAPLGLVLAFLIGFLSVRRKMCAVYVRDFSAVTVISSVIAGCVFAIMLCKESFVGIIDYADRHFIAPGESTFYSLPLALGAVVVSAFVYGALFAAACSLGAYLHEKIARKNARNQREACRKAKTDYLAMQQISEKCERAKPGALHCPVGHITEGYAEVVQDDLPQLTDAELARIERAQSKAQKPAKVEKAHFKPCIITVDAHVDPKQLHRQPVIDTPKVVLNLDEIRAGLAKAEKVFAEQATAGKPRICAMRTECRIKFDPQKVYSAEEMDEWHKILAHQGEDLGLTMIQLKADA